MKNLLTVSTIALGLALATTCANAQTAPKAKAAAKAPNHEAMPCRASTKDMYTGDQRVFTYGYCVSKLPHAGNQVAGR